MSRHLLPAPDGAEPGTWTLAGWDTRLRTYFLTIEPPDDSQTAPMYLGREPEEFRSLARFLNVLMQYKVRVPDRMVAELYFDAELDRANTETDWRDGDPVQTA